MMINNNWLVKEKNTMELGSKGGVKINQGWMF